MSDYVALAETLGNDVLVKNFERLGGNLAPWEEVSDLVDEFNAEAEDIRQVWSLSADAWPQRFQVHTHPETGYDMLAQPSDDTPPLPAQVTAANFKQWLSLTFLADEGAEFDIWFKWWFALVELDGQVKVGYQYLMD